MHWYVIHTKPRQEQRALLNLERQGYECFLPLISVEKLHRGSLTVIEEPLFPRYLFIHLNYSGTGKGWGPIRSSKGVSRLVTFGNEPAKVEVLLIETLRANGALSRTPPQSLFSPGERLVVTEGPFAGIEAIYQMSDGERRVMVLIELLNKPAQLRVAPGSLRKIG